MKCNSRPKAALAVLLAISLLATGCTAQWISVALADLPVLLQMALNIGSLVTTLQTGQQLSASEAQAIQSISAEASKDLNLLQTLYNQYQANPTASALQKIQSTVADINQNLPALLAAAHIADPVLSARVGAAVNLILATVTSFAALIPQVSGMPTGRTRRQHRAERKLRFPSLRISRSSGTRQYAVPQGKPPSIPHCQFVR